MQLRDSSTKQLKADILEPLLSCLSWNRNMAALSLFLQRDPDPRVVCFGHRMVIVRCNELIRLCHLRLMSDCYRSAPDIPIFGAVVDFYQVTGSPRWYDYERGRASLLCSLEDAVSHVRFPDMRP